MTNVLYLAFKNNKCRIGICKTVKGLEKNKGSEFYYVSLCMRGRVVFKY